jgi:hypothetical protein
MGACASARSIYECEAVGRSLIAEQLTSLVGQPFLKDALGNDEPYEKGVFLRYIVDKRL